MNSKNLQDVLSVLRALVKSNRPAYRDYLGEKTQAVKVWQEERREDVSGQTVIIGLFSDGYEPKVGGKLQVTVNGEAGEYPLENAPLFASLAGTENVLWFGSISYATLVSIWEADDPEAEVAAKYVDNWGGITLEMDGVWYAEVFLGGKYVDGTVEISKVTTVADYDIKKLPVECVPDETNRAISKAQAAAKNAQTTAKNAQTAAENAQAAAENASVQSDWDAFDAGLLSYIQNKPFGVSSWYSESMEGTNSEAVSPSTGWHHGRGNGSGIGDPIKGVIKISGRSLNDGSVEEKLLHRRRIVTGRNPKAAPDLTLDAEVYYGSDSQGIGFLYGLVLYLFYEDDRYTGHWEWRHANVAYGYIRNIDIYLPQELKQIDSVYLPLASESAPGAVLAPGKDDDYTQPVAADENGYLWAKGDAETKSAVDALKDRLTTLEEKIAELTAADTESANED